MKKTLKIIDENGRSKILQVGDYLVVLSPLKGDKNKKNKLIQENRFAHVLEIYSPDKINIQMYTSKDKYKTAVRLTLNGVKRIIKNDFNVFVSTRQILKIKKNNKIKQDEICLIKESCTIEKERFILHKQHERMSKTTLKKKQIMFLENEE